MKDEVRTAVKKEYDFSNARKNPYADKVKQQITINLNQSTVQYFKDLAEKTGLPYQTLINLYLTDCADKSWFNEHIAILANIAYNIISQ